MPAGTAATPRTFPADVAVFFVPRFPKCEIANVFLVILIVFHPAGRLQLSEIEMGEFSVIRKFVNAKINRFVFRLISEAARDEGGDHLNHLIDVTLVGGGGKLMCPFDPQCFDILEERFFKLRGGFRERNSSFTSAADRLVINVSDVHDATYLVTAQFEVPLEQIFEDIGTKIPDMCAAVDRRPTGVNVDLASGCVSRLESLEFSRVSVKKPKGHVYLVMSSGARHLLLLAE